MQNSYSDFQDFHNLHAGFKPECDPTEDLRSTVIQPDAEGTLAALFQRLNVKAAIRPTGSISNSPFAVLNSWSVHRVTFPDGTSSTHLVGISNGEGRVTTAINFINAEKRQVTTQSGRVYVLDREFGHTTHTDHLFSTWLKGAGAVQVVNQTRSVLFLLRDWAPLRARSKLADLVPEMSDTSRDQHVVLSAGHSHSHSVDPWGHD